MTYELPNSLEICGAVYEIRSDYRVALDICAALSDPELADYEKAEAALVMFYPDFDKMPSEHYQEAVDACVNFISCGDVSAPNKKSPKLMDWEQDFRFIAPAINRVLGTEIRSIKYDAETNTGGLHWWTFIGAYYEIGECLFNQIVAIRSKKSTGKKLEKSEREWYRNNRDIIDIKAKYTESEKDALAALGIK